MPWLAAAGGGTAAGTAAGATAGSMAAGGAAGQSLASLAAGGNLGAANAAISGGQIGGGLGSMADLAGLASQFQGPMPASAPFPLSSGASAPLPMSMPQREEPQVSYYVNPLGRVSVRPILPTV